MEVFGSKNLNLTDFLLLKEFGAKYGYQSNFFDKDDPKLKEVLAKIKADHPNYIEQNFPRQ